MLQKVRNRHHHVLRVLRVPLDSLLGHDDNQNNTVRLFSLIALATLLLIAIATALIVIHIGCPVTIRFVEDVPILLDGAWRVYQGHVPHHDFYTPLGPITLMILSVGMHVAGPVTTSIAYANAMLLGIVMLWAWAISRPRMTVMQAWLFTLYAGSLIAGVHVFGWDNYVSGYSAIYNRYATATLAVVLVEAFGILHPHTPHTRWAHAIGGFSTGFLLVILFFLKINYFGMSMLACVFAPLVVRSTRWRWGGVAIGIVVATLTMLIYLRFDVVALQHDMSLAVNARSNMLASQVYHYIGGLMQRFSTERIIAPLLLFLTWRAIPTTHSPLVGRGGLLPLPSKIRHATIALFFAMMHVAIFLTNTQLETPALLPVFGLLMIAEYRSLPLPHTDVARANLFNTTLLPLASYAVLLTTMMIMPAVASLGFARYYQQEHMPTRFFDSVSMHDFYLDLTSTNNNEYLGTMNDGFALLRQHSAPTDHILVLAFTNPFSFGLLRPSPQGDALWWHENLSFSLDAHPTVERVFHDVDVVMVPQNIDDESGLWQLYGTYLQQHFALTARSDYWRLFLRTHVDGASSTHP